MNHYAPTLEGLDSYIAFSGYEPDNFSDATSLLEGLGQRAATLDNVEDWDRSVTQVGDALILQGLSFEEAYGSSASLHVGLAVAMDQGLGFSWPGESYYKKAKKGLSKAWSATKGAGKAIGRKAEQVGKYLYKKGASAGEALTKGPLWLAKNTIDPLLKKVGLPKISPLLDPRILAGDFGLLSDWAFEVLYKVLKFILGKNIARKVVDLMRALTTGAMKNFVMWNVDIFLGIIMTIKDTVTAPGGLKGKGIKFANGIMTVLSTSILTAPGVIDVIQVVAIITSKQRPETIRKELKKLAKKDPPFGLQVVSFIIGVALGGEARIIANPMGFAAEVMALLRNVMREICKEVFRMGDKAAIKFDQIYGIVMLSLSKVMSMSEALSNMGISKKKAKKLAKDMYNALKKLRFGDIPKMFNRIFKALGADKKKISSFTSTVQAAVGGSTTKAMISPKSSKRKGGRKKRKGRRSVDAGQMGKALASTRDKKVYQALKSNWTKFGKVARNSPVTMYDTLRKSGFGNDAARVMTNLMLIEVHEVGRIKVRA